MSKIVLDKGSTNFDPLVYNENFRKIENEFNDKVLYRDNPSGGPNEMNDDLDMNSNRIYNLPAPTEEHEAARLKDVQDAVRVDIDSNWDSNKLFSIGIYRLWVDNSGQLRIKPSNPTSDIDGAVVGS